MKGSLRYYPAARTDERSGAFRLRRVAIIAMFAFAVLGGVQPTSAQAAEAMEGDVPVEFDSMFLRVDSGAAVDVTRFARGNPVKPGVYSVDLLVNGIRVARQDVRFVETSPQAGADRKSVV